MKSTTSQAATRKRLEAEGFLLIEQNARVLVMRRGNDLRIVQQDGMQRRAWPRQEGSKSRAGEVFERK